MSKDQVGETSKLGIIKQLPVMIQSTKVLKIYNIKKYRTAKHPMVKCPYSKKKTYGKQSSQREVDTAKCLNNRSIPMKICRHI